MPGGKAGIAIFIGNAEAPQNYRGNDYKFRQESSFLYYWGIDEPGFAALLDLDSGEEVLYGDDVEIGDIIWMGPQPSASFRHRDITMFSRQSPSPDALRRMPGLWLL